VGVTSVLKIVQLPLDIEVLLAMKLRLGDPTERVAFPFIFEAVTFVRVERSKPVV
jgi:hypothetical protein